MPVWQERETAVSTQPPLIVWLQGAQQPNPAPLQAAPGLRGALPNVPKPPVPAFAEAATVSVRSSTSPQAITLPVPSTVPTAAAELDKPSAAASMAPPAGPSSAPPASAPLNLALPRDSLAARRGQGGERNPALEDPRSNSPRASLESRIAAALGGSDQITEFRMQDGSVRLQRGQACVVVRPSRDSSLDPFNAAAQQRPRLVDRC